MSYARKNSDPAYGELSDVYVYGGVGGGLECCGCELVDWVTKGWPKRLSNLKMLAHLNKHIQHGHKVPIHTILRLHREYIESHWWRSTLYWLWYCLLPWRVRVWVREFQQWRRCL